MKVTRAERFWSRVTRKDQCLVWTGTKDRDGYGKVTWYGRTMRAHRVAYLLANGNIPSGSHVCHSCDRPECVTPKHLWLGSNAENHADSAAKARAKNRWTGPRQLAKLTPKLVRYARRRYALGDITQARLATELGITQSHITNVLSGRRWGSVT